MHPESECAVLGLLIGSFLKLVRIEKLGAKLLGFVMVQALR